MSRPKRSRRLHFAWAIAALVLATRPALAGSGDPAPVVGGTPAPAGKWPDVAAVMDSSGFTFCTGTLVAPQVVVTAGHCVDGQDVAQVMLDAVDTLGEGEVVPVARAVAYPDWEVSSDIGVLVLAGPALTDPRPVATECVVTESLVPGAPVSLVGYGATTTTGTDPNTRLNEGQAAIVDPDCSTTQGCQPAVSPGGEFVVAGDGVDSCFGDSGGPVYLPTPEGIVLAGVVSRGVSTDPVNPCGSGGIYVRPDSLIEWIEQNAGLSINKATCAPPPPPPAPDPPQNTGDGTGEDTSGDVQADSEPASVTGGCAVGDRRAGGGSILALIGLALLLMRRRGA